MWKDRKKPASSTIDFREKSAGTFLAVTRKIFPIIIGDGLRSLRELILGDPRASLIAATYLDRFQDIANIVLGEGERKRLWDGFSLQQETHTWNPQHWFSPSPSDAGAERDRGKAFRNSWRNTPGGTLPWVRQSHAYHIPRPGAFSVCVHRADAATVGYMQDVFGRTAIQVGYPAGRACGKQELDSCTIPPIASQQIRMIA